MRGSFAALNYSSSTCYSSTFRFSGRHFKRWKKRWFVLQDSTLYSFKKESVYENPTEVIDLRVFSSVKSSEVLFTSFHPFFTMANIFLIGNVQDYTNRQYSFDVYSSDLVFSMVAASEGEKEGFRINSYKSVDPSIFLGAQTGFARSAEPL